MPSMCAALLRTNALTCASNEAEKHLLSDIRGAECCDGMISNTELRMPLTQPALVAEVLHSNEVDKVREAYDSVSVVRLDTAAILAHARMHCSAVSLPSVGRKECILCWGGTLNILQGAGLQ